jgi:hypothetical protein
MEETLMTSSKSGVHSSSIEISAPGGLNCQKRKGLQLALEPLNGPGIAGYVPEP